jgi:hypothetical protein
MEVHADLLASWSYSSSVWNYLEVGVGGSQSDKGEEVYGTGYSLMLSPLPVGSLSSNSWVSDESVIRPSSDLSPYNNSGK